jgi:hypothetical protein
MTDLNRRSFLGLALGLAGAAAVGELPSIALPKPEASPAPIPASRPNVIYLESGDSIQAAINALPDDGGTIYLREGVYVTNQDFTIPKDVTLIGEGNNGFVNCAVVTSSTVMLGRGNNTIIGCYIEGRDNLNAAFSFRVEDTVETPTTIIGNAWSDVKHFFREQYREITKLIRGTDESRQYPARLLPRVHRSAWEG